MSYVLWIAIFSGAGSVAMTHQRFDTMEACEQAAADVRNMPMVREKLQLASRGITAFKVDHVCSKGASTHQGGE